MQPDYQLAIKKAGEFFKLAALPAVPPIDVFLAAARLNITVLKNDLQRDISGYLFIDGNGPPIIGVNLKHEIQRQRFSVAHELGHFLLHAPRSGTASFVDKSFFIFNRDARSSLGIDTKEIEANYFAAEILMPAAGLYRAVATNAASVNLSALCRTLADTYQVSPDAMRFRLSNLGFLRV